MSQSSLTIEDRAAYANILADARANGSIDSLIENIANFTISERVVLRAHRNGSEFAIAWYHANETRPYMIGGLIYHASTNDWSVHT